MSESSNSKIPNPKTVQTDIIREHEFYTEGPVIDKAGNLFFTDLSGGSIWRLKDGVAEIWAKGERPNGQVILEDGSHLVCDSAAGWVAHYDIQGKIMAKIGSGHIENVPVHCPSDITLDSNGFYFTDSVRYNGSVFYVGFNGKSNVVAQNIDYPNGIVCSPDGKRLFVAESYGNRILKIDLEALGHSKGAVSVFASLPFNSDDRIMGNLPDGIALDSAGRLWVAHYGMQAVHVLSTSGDLLASYDSGMQLTSNICFSGSDAIITGGKGEPGPGMLTKIKNSLIVNEQKN